MPHYVDAAYRQQVETLRQRFTARTEWPTWLLLIGVYGGWFAIVLNSHWLGRALSTLLATPPACVPSTIPLSVSGVASFSSNSLSAAKRMVLK